MFIIRVLFCVFIYKTQMTLKTLQHDPFFFLESLHFIKCKVHAMELIH